MKMVDQKLIKRCTNKLKSNIRIPIMSLKVLYWGKGVVCLEPQWLSGLCVRLIFGWSLDRSTTGVKTHLFAMIASWTIGLTAQCLNWFPSSVQPNTLKGLAKFSLLSVGCVRKGIQRKNTAKSSVQIYPLWRPLMEQPERRIRKYWGKGEHF